MRPAGARAGAVPENPAAWEEGSLALVRRVEEPGVFLLASASPPPSAAAGGASCGTRARAGSAGHGEVLLRGPRQEIGDRRRPLRAPSSGHRAEPPRLAQCR